MQARVLTEANGDLAKAEVICGRGIGSASKKASGNEEGIVASYIHLQGKVGCWWK